MEFTHNAIKICWKIYSYIPKLHCICFLVFPMLLIFFAHLHFKEFSQRFAGNHKNAFCKTSFLKLSLFKDIVWSWARINKYIFLCNFIIVTNRGNFDDKFWADKTFLRYRTIEVADVTILIRILKTFTVKNWSYKFNTKIWISFTVPNLPLSQFSIFGACDFLA